MRDRARCRDDGVECVYVGAYLASRRELASHGGGAVFELAACLRPGVLEVAVSLFEESDRHRASSAPVCEWHGESL
jgi:hypothetical protein